MPAIRGAGQAILSAHVLKGLIILIIIIIVTIF